MVVFFGTVSEAIPVDCCSVVLDCIILRSNLSVIKVPVSYKGKCQKNITENGSIKETLISHMVIFLAKDKQNLSLHIVYARKTAIL